MNIQDGRLTDFTAGHITSPEGQALIETLQAELGRPEIEFHAGVSYRNLMIYRGRAGASPFSSETVTDPPHDHPDQPAAEHLPRRAGLGSPQRVDEPSGPAARKPPRERGPNRRGEAAGECDLALGTGEGAERPEVCGPSRPERGDHLGRRPGPGRGRAGRLDANRRARVRPVTSTPTTPPRAGPPSRRSGITTSFASTSRPPTRPATRDVPTPRSRRIERIDREIVGPVRRSPEVSRPMADRDLARPLDIVAHPGPRPGSCGLGHGRHGPPRLGHGLRRIRGLRPAMSVLRSGIPADAAIPRPGLGRDAFRRADRGRRPVAATIPRPGFGRACGVVGRNRSGSLQSDRGNAAGSDTVAVARSEVRRDQRGGFRQDPGRCATGDPGPQARGAGPRRGLGPRAHDRRIDRAGQGDHRDPARSRDGHAPLDRRAGQRRLDGDGHREPGRAGDQLHGCADRPGHGQLPHQGPDPEHLDRADGPGAGRGEDRDRGRLPGRGRALQHHDARPGRFGYDGRRPGRRARRGGLRDLHRRRRRLHHRPADRPRGPQDRSHQLRRDARARRASARA